MENFTNNNQEGETIFFDKNNENSFKNKKNNITIAFIFAFIYSLFFYLVLNLYQRFDFYLLTKDNVIINFFIYFPTKISTLIAGLLKAESFTYVLGFGSQIFIPAITSFFWFVILFVFLWVILRKIENKIRYIFLFFPLIIIAITFLPYAKNSTFLKRVQTCLTEENKENIFDYCINEIIYWYIKEGENPFIFQNVNNKEDELFKKTAKEIMTSCLKLPNEQINLKYIKETKQGLPDKKSDICLYGTYDLLTQYATPNFSNSGISYFLGTEFNLENVKYLDVKGDNKTREKYIKMVFCNNLESMEKSKTKDYCVEKIAIYPKDDFEKIVEKELFNEKPKGESAWLDLNINLPNEADIFSFKAIFKGEDEKSLGRLVVFIDEKEIASINEESVPPGENSYKIKFNKILPGTHHVKVEAIPINKEFRSTVEVYNMQFGTEKIK